MTLAATHPEAPLKPDARPRQRAGLRCHELDDEAVLYDLAHHAVHYLNATAYAVWRQCDGRTPVAKLPGRLATHFSIAEDDSLIADTHRALRGMAENGLVDWGAA
ncbi:MAG: PqqD family protein [Planctomycetes bacterium]|nr:PqqD family protein [Planctomycetota bacterium]